MRDCPTCDRLIDNYNAAALERRNYDAADALRDFDDHVAAVHGPGRPA